MSMRNFPKIPKIIVRKSVDQAKDTKIPNYESAILIFRKYVYFYVALPIILLFETLKLSISDKVDYATSEP